MSSHAARHAARGMPAVHSELFSNVDYDAATLIHGASGRLCDVLAILDLAESAAAEMSAESTQAQLVGSLERVIRVVKGTIAHVTVELERAETALKA
ncbi:hypothetical protein C7441_11465 [Pseudaminobacter salicylatoxidans]|uniref:Uncharacterized protein n=1 Tax=Pseudaminobacter salicylatoxidans TaxID=93369 RepID=A0A316BYP9_PSESE|nr:hypothetical protein [Pseudaminobacter salicylatoxidans]PWJ79788.1 hypothetical protein C7441_11465 [Pseudaminobacter salicylatoxidans]